MRSMPRIITNASGLKPMNSTNEFTPTVFQVRENQNINSLSSESNNSTPILNWNEMGAENSSDTIKNLENNQEISTHTKKDFENLINPKALDWNPSLDFRWNKKTFKDEEGLLNKVKVLEQKFKKVKSLEDPEILEKWVEVPIFEESN